MLLSVDWELPQDAIREMGEPIYRVFSTHCVATGAFVASPDPSSS
jgi:hypothetical protein